MGFISLIAGVTGSGVFNTIVPSTACAAEPSIAAIQKQVFLLQTQLAQVQATLARQLAHERALEQASARDRRNSLRPKVEVAAQAPILGSAPAARQDTRQVASAQQMPATSVTTVRAPLASRVGGFISFPQGNGVNTVPAQNIPDNSVGPHRPQTANGQAATPLGRRGVVEIGGLTVQLGGYIDVLGVTRQRNEVADWVSNLGGTPYPNSPQYHEREFRGTANGTRLSLLLSGHPNAQSYLAAYVETDFGSSAATSNSVESSSYTIRMRQAYATYDHSGWGLHLLGGQAWSMISPFNVGITPRQEALTINPDGQTSVGYAWQRQWQVRIVKDFDAHRLWAGLSFEKPQATFGGTYPNTASLNLSNPGVLTLNPLANYSDDIAPDVIAKLAYDPAWGHYEIYGLLRFIDTNLIGRHPRTDTTAAGGGGAAVVLPLIPKVLQFQAQTLIGQGIGRYGSALLPDATVSDTGKAVPIPEAQVFVGLTYHPTRAVDLYAYGGTEQQSKRAYNRTLNGVTSHYGWGNGSYVNVGCFSELGGTCTGNTRGVVETTLGGWWRIQHSRAGTVEVGGSWSWLQRTGFDGIGGAPRGDNNIIMLDFRYLPFL